MNTHPSLFVRLIDKSKIEGILTSIRERGINEGDTVYARHLIGRKACCEAPAALFCRRNDVLIVTGIEVDSTGKIWYRVRHAKGTGEWSVGFRDITKMKPFSHNYSDEQKYYDSQREQDYVG
ncbi:hypothetical protein AVT69_gp244 [Pseudomonas phage PhiPA3]|uniref:Uncharacterized protein 246 n=1 Tax=Pseudomonas phage PhiPA3 TaxID=998086 RepID=F8SJ89_BPPA3|nr:hypothetical protein AVT69_gp244 [Pseudomonas phage PhiPA3]AEH03669.1 hypothetical protein [Pseudomonas phage PhiPA3]